MTSGATSGVSSPSLLARRLAVLGQHAPLFYQEPLHLVRGQGVWLWDDQGNRYLDVYNNVPQVGHCHPRVVEAMTQQASTLNLHTRYLHDNVVRYAERLTAKFDASLSSAMFVCSGSEANELALRMARHHTNKQGIIVTDFAYHGNTEAVAELGNAFMPEAATTRRVKPVPMPDTYRGPEGIAEADWEDHYVAAVQRAIDELEAEGVGCAGILMCPAFANEGLLSAPGDYLSRAVGLVRAAGGLFIADEVQGGFGRTGANWWSHQNAGVIPDIVTLGKPMGNGYPLAGVITTAALVEEFGAWGMYFNTFAGNPVASAVGMAVLNILEEEALLNNACTTGAHIAAGLRELQTRHEVIGDVRDQGLFFAVEMVQDRDSKTPATEACGRLVESMRRRGVLISRIGRHDHVLKMRPPLPFDPGHGDLLLAALDESLAECRA